MDQCCQLCRQSSKAIAAIAEHQHAGRDIMWTSKVFSQSDHANSLLHQLASRASAQLPKSSFSARRRHQPSIKSILYHILSFVLLPFQDAYGERRPERLPKAALSFTNPFHTQCAATCIIKSIRLHILHPPEKAFLSSHAPRLHDIATLSADRISSTRAARTEQRRCRKGRT